METKKIRENDVKRAVRQYLELLGYDVYPINNGGVWNAKRQQFIFHGKKGMCDLIAIKPPKILFIETKAPGKKLSEEQEEFMRSVNCCFNISSHAVDSFDAFKEEIDKCQI